MAEARPGGDGATRRAEAWWRGRRGEWYVVLQFVLFALVAAGPTTWNGQPAWEFPDGRVVSAAGAVLIAGGAVLAIAGARQHGAGLQALPYPRQDGTLLDSGPYRIVRHPIYSGVVCIAFGWAIWRRGWLTLLYAALLFLLFDAKARREERWLVEKFPSYAGYQRRVRKLLPFLY
jgi:protein-S-isoprenylcysteine O-methyltransferase Ste14